MMPRNLRNQRRPVIYREGRNEGRKTGMQECRKEGRKEGRKGAGREVIENECKVKEGISSII